MIKEVLRGLLLPSVLLLLYGCGRNIGDRVVIDGKVLICPPSGWTVDEEKSGGAVVINGEGGRLNVTVLDAPSTVRDPEDLMDTLRAMSPGFRVTKQADFDAAGSRGKEFVVSCLEDGRKQNGSVYLVRMNKKLCILTFIARGGDLKELLDVFRESAGTLRFLETFADENKDSKV